MGSSPRLSIVKGPHQDITPRPLYRIFEENLNQHSDNTAVIYNNCPKDNESNIHLYSYAQINSKSNQFARLVVTEAEQRIIKPNSDGDYIIAVCMQPSDNMICTLMAIWKAGAAYLPIDPSFSDTRIQHILKEAQPIMVLRDDDISADRFGSSTSFSLSELGTLSQNLSKMNLQTEEQVGGTMRNLAIVLYTSGSTGIPKGVRLSHDVILNRLEWQWQTFPYSLTETVAVFKTALTFVDSVAELWAPLLSGLAVLVVPKATTKNPEQLVELLQRYKIRRLVLVPALLNSLLLYLNANKNSKLLCNLQFWICSGEPLNVFLASKFYDYFQEGAHLLLNFYGSTEVMGDVTYFACESKQQLSQYDNVPIGIPVSNVIIYLLDEDKIPVEHGNIGEIYVAGRNVANGYVNGRDPDKFIENPHALEKTFSRLYRTGDYGSLQNGQIMYQGRTDSQIKLRGHRIDLTEVERNVNELTIVEKAVVLVHHPNQFDQSLVAFVKLNNDAPKINELQLEAMLKLKLTDYMVPQVVIIETVPLLVNGKVDRQKLLNDYETDNSNQGDVLKFDYSKIPNDQLKAAKDLVELVGAVIGRSIRATLDLNSNFYELGGNSLNSVLTATLLKEKGYDIGISDFISSKNLGEILNKMTKYRDANTISDEQKWLKSVPHLDMEAIPIENCHKKAVTAIIVDSFYNKGKLEEWVKPNIYRSDYRDLVNDLWNTVISTKLSFVVRDRNSNRIIGTSLNFESRSKLNLDSNLLPIFEFVGMIEGPIGENLKQQGFTKILRASMMGTSADLKAKENIACIYFMNNNVLKIAQQHKFQGILTTNTHPLTQQLASSVFNYKALVEYQINQYVHRDGSRPYAKAPDTQKAMVHWKEII